MSAETISSAPRTRKVSNTLGTFTRIARETGIMDTPAHVAESNTTTQAVLERGRTQALTTTDKPENIPPITENGNGHPSQEHNPPGAPVTDRDLRAQEIGRMMALSVGLNEAQNRAAGEQRRVRGGEIRGIIQDAQGETGKLFAKRVLSVEASSVDHTTVVFDRKPPRRR
jgi:hypothetical protein